MHSRLLMMIATILALSACASSGSQQSAPAAPPPPATNQTAAPNRPAELPQVTLIKSIQTELIRLGFYNGAPDGLMGPKTRAAIEDFQRFRHLPATGTPSQALLDQLKAN